MTYNASSPDELALTNAARHFGVIFESRDEESNIVIYHKSLDVRYKYQLLNVIEFTSDRKRMSVIVKTPEDKIILMTKGADSTILPRLRSGQDFLIDETLEYVQDFATEGLRTLLVGQREIEPSLYAQWSKKYQAALASLQNRDENISLVADLIEK